MLYAKKQKGSIEKTCLLERDRRRVGNHWFIPQPRAVGQLSRRTNVAARRARRGPVTAGWPPEALAVGPENNIQHVAVRALEAKQGLLSRRVGRKLLVVDEIIRTAGALVAGAPS